jgi:hypothetical protein
MNLTTYFLIPLIRVGNFFMSYIFYKIGWSVLTDHARGSPPSATPNIWTEPVSVLTTDNTKIQIIIDNTKQYDIYLI